MRKLVFLCCLSLIISSCGPDYSDLADGMYADMDTDKGHILLELYYEQAPLTVANFVTLAEGNNPQVSDSLKGKKYFDELGFHRVVPDFIIQGGDPQGDGRGGPGYRFYNELSPDLRHDTAGILSMANSGGVKTNGSQFFITHKPTPWLDGYNNDGTMKDCSLPGAKCHSVFGKVVTGQDVVDSIAQYDMIKSVKIVRIGEKANGFDAVKEFVDGMVNAEQKEQQRIADIAKNEEIRIQNFKAAQKIFEEKMEVDKAKKMDSGLKVLTFKRGKGKKFNSSIQATIDYTIYLSNGTLVQSSEGRSPLKFVMDQLPLIPGVTEAIKTMREGGKKRLFIPYYLGYGENGGGPFPKKADLVFDIELLKVGQ
jgi:cyclophilin family peptidyl-prolyl cis-trans isomerase